MRATTIAACGMLCLAGAVRAGSTETWNFDVTTDGNDIFWTSPTSVRTDARIYIATTTFTSVIVTVTVFGFPVDIEGIDQVPPEFQMVTEELSGPLPAVLIDEAIVAPEPPEPPGIAFDLLVEFDATGFGQMEMTNVVLGTVVVDGVGTLPIEKIHALGTVEITPVGIYGDATLDDVVDVFDVLAVLGAWGSCDTPPCLEDINKDNLVDVFDLLIVLDRWQ